jgi:hypothetical protein
MDAPDRPMSTTLRELLAVVETIEAAGVTVTDVFRMSTRDDWRLTVPSSGIRAASAAAGGTSLRWSLPLGEHCQVECSIPGGYLVQSFVPRRLAPEQVRRMPEPTTYIEPIRTDGATQEPR